MQPLACQTCEAQVSVAKYSPAHTSVQWTAQAARACHEIADAADSPHYLLRCASLNASVDAATQRGEIDLSLRSEPRIVPLTAGDAPAPPR